MAKAKTEWYKTKLWQRMMGAVWAIVGLYLLQDIFRLLLDFGKYIIGAVLVYGGLHLMFERVENG